MQTTAPVKPMRSASQPESEFVFQTAAEFMATTPPYQWLIPDVVPTRGVLLIRSEHSAAVSVFALTMAMSLASAATTWLGRPISHRLGPIAYAAVLPHGEACEKQERRFAHLLVDLHKDRIKARQDRSAPHLLSFIGGCIDLVSPEGVAALIAQAAGCKMLVIDSLPAVDPDNANRLANNLRHIAQQIDGLVVVCADVSDNSALAAVSETVIRIDPGHTWTVEKQREAREGAGGSFELISEPIAANAQAQCIRVEVKDFLLYAIRQEWDGTWSLLNRKHAVLETIADFAPTEGLFTKTNARTGKPEVWFYSDDIPARGSPHRSKENLARYAAVLNKAFAGELPRSARIALEAARVSLAQQARR
jgi:hypothetical protein